MLPSGRCPFPARPLSGSGTVLAAAVGGAAGGPPSGLRARRLPALPPGAASPRFFPGGAGPFFVWCGLGPLGLAALLRGCGVRVGFPPSFPVFFPAGEEKPEARWGFAPLSRAPWVSRLAHLCAGARPHRAAPGAGFPARFTFRKLSTAAPARRPSEYNRPVKAQAGRAAWVHASPRRAALTGRFPGNCPAGLDFRPVPWYAEFPRPVPLLRGPPLPGCPWTARKPLGLIDQAAFFAVCPCIRRPLSVLDTGHVTA